MMRHARLSTADRLQIHNGGGGKKGGLNSRNTQTRTHTSTFIIHLLFNTGGQMLQIQKDLEMSEGVHVESFTLNISIGLKKNKREFSPIRLAAA